MGTSLEKSERGKWKLEIGKLGNWEIGEIDRARCKGPELDFRHVGEWLALLLHETVSVYSLDEEENMQNKRPLTRSTMIQVSTALTSRHADPSRRSERDRDDRRVVLARSR